MACCRSLLHDSHCSIQENSAVTLLTLVEQFVSQVFNAKFSFLESELFPFENIHTKGAIMSLV